MSVSRLNLFRLIAKDEGLGYDSGTCSETGTITTIIDSSTDSPLQPEDDEERLKNWWAMIEADSAGTPLNVSEVRRVKTYTPSTSTLTLPTGRGYTNATTATQSYGLYAHPPTRHGGIKGLDEYINSRLRNLFYKTLALLTDAPDGDFETSTASTISTYWTASNTTLAKVTSGVGVTAGGAAMQATTTAANGYFTMATDLRCSAGEVKEIVVDCTPTSGSWKLQAYDVTNSAEIDVTGAYGGIQPRRLWLRISIPSSCESWNVRLIGETDATVCVFDNLSFRDPQSKFLALPSWLLRDEWLGEVWIYPPGTQRDNAYAIGEWGRYPPIWFGVQESYTDNTPFKLEMDANVRSGSHIFLEAKRPYAELSADSDTTDCDQDFLKYLVLEDIYSARGDKANTERVIMQFRNLGLERHVPRITRRRMMPREY